MSTRVVLGEEFTRAVQVRGLTVEALAQLAGVARPTASAALAHHRLNLTSAMRLCRAVRTAPVVDELDEWVVRPRHPSAA